MANKYKIKCPDCNHEFTEELTADLDPRDEDCTIESECPECPAVFNWGIDEDGGFAYFDDPDSDEPAALIVETDDHGGDQDDEEEEEEDGDDDEEDPA